MMYIFELANNHNGFIDEAIEIIDAVKAIKDKYKLDAAIKFQYRDIDTFIHEDFVNSDIKHITRFVSTRMLDSEYADLARHVKKNGLKLVVTPFDEISVKKAIDNGVDILKVASCSMTDWPLLDEISKTEKPVIVSTGGHTLEQIDDVVSYFKHKHIDISLLHCVSMYPLSPRHANVGIIKKLKARYKISVGYSGHEVPVDNKITSLALACGAEIFERHIGFKNINKYSLNFEQAEKWIIEMNDTSRTLGRWQKLVNDNELVSIKSLQRGCYANKRIDAGMPITIDDVYFSMPLQEEQTTSGEIGQYRAQIFASRDYMPDEPIKEAVTVDEKINRVRKYIHRIKGLINEAGVDIGNAHQAELSHHYGIENFDEYGAAIISLINREYCKKLIVMLPGQKHPEHLHKHKEETFHVLHGSMMLKVGESMQLYKRGDIILVERHRPHQFETETGVIFEEISSTHIQGDSFYTDISIYDSDPIERKSTIEKL